MFIFARAGAWTDRHGGSWPGGRKKAALGRLPASVRASVSGQCGLRPGAVAGNLLNVTGRDLRVSGHTALRLPGRASHGAGQAPPESVAISSQRLRRSQQTQWPGPKDCPGHGHGHRDESRCHRRRPGLAGTARPGGCRARGIPGPAAGLRHRHGDSLGRLTVTSHHDGPR